MTHDELLAQMKEFVDKWYLSSVESDLILDTIDVFPELSEDEIRNYIQVEAYGKFNACWSY